MSLKTEALSRNWLAIWCTVTCSVGMNFLGNSFAWAESAPASWRTGPFICRSAFPEEENARVREVLSEALRDVKETLELGRLDESVEILLFADRASYTRHLKAVLPSVPYRRAMFVKGRGPGQVWVHYQPDWEEDLRHEGTHAVLHASLPFVPLWLDEGLAEYFEVTRDRQVDGHAHLGWMQFASHWGYMPSLRKLEGRSDLADMRGRDYRAAWAWVHFMLHGPPPARDALQRFLRDTRQDRRPPMLSQELTANVPSLRSAFLRHFQDHAVTKRRLHARSDKFGLVKRLAKLP